MEELLETINMFLTPARDVIYVGEEARNMTLGSKEINESLEEYDPAPMRGEGLEQWLFRIGSIGNVTFTYYPSDGGKRKVTQAAFLKILTDPTMLNVFGIWDIKKKKASSSGAQVVMGRKHKRGIFSSDKEKVVVDIKFKKQK